MKNFKILFFSILLFQFFACGGGTNNGLLAAMKANLETLETLPDPTDNLKILSDLNNLLQNAPEAMRQDSAFVSVQENVETLLMKYGAMDSQKADLESRLHTLSTEYATGKLKTEEVQAEMEAISTGVTLLNDGYTGAQEVFRSVSAQYGMMKASFNAKQEEEKAEK